MILTPEIKKLMDQSVLCWVASVSEGGMPNVSPKEIFRAYGDEQIIVANIASPQTVRNIGRHPQLCISFIDVLVQKGYQVKGQARIAGATDPEFQKMKKSLEQMTDGKFPFSTITVLNVESVKPILAPSYQFFPETREADQVEAAKRLYGLS